jgi:hypothetical protein
VNFQNQRSQRIATEEAGDQKEKPRTDEQGDGSQEAAAEFVCIFLLKTMYHARGSEGRKS